MPVPEQQLNSDGLTADRLRLLHHRGETRVRRSHGLCALTVMAPVAPPITLTDAAPLHIQCTRCAVDADAVSHALPAARCSTRVAPRRPSPAPQSTGSRRNSGVGLRPATSPHASSLGTLGLLGHHGRPHRYPAPAIATTGMVLDLLQWCGVVVVRS
jgi:hypothetical protein